MSASKDSNPRTWAWQRCHFGFEVRIDMSLLQLLLNSTLFWAGTHWNKKTKDCKKPMQNWLKLIWHLTISCIFSSKRMLRSELNWTLCNMRWDWRSSCESGSNDFSLVFSMEPLFDNLSNFKMRCLVRHHQLIHLEIKAKMSRSKVLRLPRTWTSLRPRCWSNAEASKQSCSWWLRASRPLKADLSLRLWLMKKSWTQRGSVQCVKLPLKSKWNRKTLRPMSLNISVTKKEKQSATLTLSMMPMTWQDLFEYRTNDQIHTVITICSSKMYSQLLLKVRSHNLDRCHGNWHHSVLSYFITDKQTGQVLPH